MTHPDPDLQQQARDQLRALSELGQQAFRDQTGTDLPDPTILTIEYHGEGGELDFDSVETAFGDQEVHREARRAVSYAIKGRAEIDMVVDCLTRLAGHEGWHYKTDGGGGEIRINLNSGNVMSFEHHNFRVEKIVDRVDVAALLPLSEAA